jgi:hypothetical protein
LHPGLQGIARIAVDDANAQLTVTFLVPLVLPRDAYLFNPKSYSLSGGQNVFPHVTQVQPAGLFSPPFTDEPSVVLSLNRIGDFSIYTLSVNGPGIDPFFASHKLRFRLSCDDRFDCRTPAAAPPVPAQLDVNIDYLAKDYSSFRQAFLDFIPTRLPNWTERSEADLGIVLLELLAATGDNLSYLQDRVANEAFLSSATQRRSVAGHLALIGYQMDEGASAYTFLRLQVNTLHTLISTPAQPGLTVSNAPRSANEPLIIFETLGSATLRPQHNRIAIYTWSNQSCCLPATATSMALAGVFGDLNSGDYLLIEDNQGHRDVVRLNSKPEILSPLSARPGNPGSPPLASPPLGSPPTDLITVVSWSVATPLHYDYCLCGTSSSPPAACTWVCANVVPATHGETVTEDIRNLSPDQVRVLQLELAALPPGARRLRQRLPLSHPPLAHLDPSVAALANGVSAPAPAVSDPVAQILTRAPKTISTLHITVKGTSGDWQEKETLLNSGPEDQVFRVEINDQGLATVVFGDGQFGMRPDESAQVTATYRVGGGSVGNIAADTLTRLTRSEPWLDSVCNPVPAQGGRDLESRQHARTVGPPTSHNPLVAVTTSDYQSVAESFVDQSQQHPVQRANATFQWTGSWLTASLSVEPAASTALSSDLQNELIRYLDGRRLAGYDLQIISATYVPLDIIVEFCTASGFRSADVQQGILLALSNQDLPGGKKGFFHHGLFTFGDYVFVSRMYAAIMAVPGVDSAQITRLARLHSPFPDTETSTNLAQGFLQVASDQIVQLDNDRNFPQNGTLSVVPKGAE